MQHLAMSGWQRFTLIDPDDLDTVNLVKHPGHRKDLGRRKINIAMDWLADRNPSAKVDAIDADIFQLPEADLLKLMQESEMIVVATDNNSTRHYLNDLCIQAKRPMTVGLVHRGGRGGTVFAFRPGTTGCYACLELVAEGHGVIPVDPQPPLNETEKEMIYGRSQLKYGLAGLSCDISIVAGLHASITVGELLSIESRTTSELSIAPANWLSINLRSSDDTVGLASALLEVPPIDDCYCTQ